MQTNYCLDSCQSGCCNAHGLCPDNFDPQQYGTDYTQCFELGQETVDPASIIIPIVVCMGFFAVFAFCFLRVRRQRMQEENNQQQIIYMEPTHKNSNNLYPNNYIQNHPGQNYNLNYYPNFNNGAPPEKYFNQPQSGNNCQTQNPYNSPGPVKGNQTKQTPIQQPNSNLPPPYLQNYK